MNHVVAAEPLFEALLDHSSDPVRRILEGAERCLRRSGYGEMSMRDIAAEAGVSKSLLHYHFLSKEHLFREVQISVYNRLAARIAAAVSTDGSGAHSSLKGLDALFDVLRHDADLPVQTEIWSRALTNAKLRARAVRLREYLREVAIDTIDRLLGSAKERFPLGVEEAADLLLAAIGGLSLQAGVDEGPERVEAAFQGLRRIVQVALDGDSENSESQETLSSTQSWRR